MLTVTELARIASHYATRMADAMIAEVWEMPASVKAAVGIRHEWRGEDE